MQPSLAAFRHPLWRELPRYLSQLRLQGIGSVPEPCGLEASVQDRGDHEEGQFMLYINPFTGLLSFQVSAAQTGLTSLDIR